MDKDTSVRTSSGRKKMRINFIDIILILICCCGGGSRLYYFVASD